MRIILSIAGVLLTLMGVVWILQGINVLLGSMMSGHIEYSILGLIVAAIGIGLFAFANRRAKVVGGGDDIKRDR